MKKFNSYYQFEIFDRFRDVLTHAVSTREHGSLDSAENTQEDAENRKNFARLLEIESANLAFARQVHSDRVLVLDDALNENFKFEEGDSLITNVKNQAIFVKMADCQALLFFDPFKKVVAAVHSGWRGSVQNITGKTIQKMMKDFACDPKDILAGVSYSLGPCCSYFSDPFNELPAGFHKYILEDGHSVDFWRASLDQLLATGVLMKNIECARICTKCRADEFYSYRAEKESAGRMGALICLK